MRQALSALLTLLLLGAALSGCKASRPAKPPGVDTPPPGTAAPPASNQTASGTDPQPAGACTPGATAVDLPSRPYGTGIDLKPPQPGGTAERPWLGFISVDQMGGGSTGTIYMRKGGTATVSTGTIWLRGMLDPAPSREWYDAHVKLEGVQPLRQDYHAGMEGRFDFQIPGGNPGEAFRLTVKEVLLADGTRGDVTVTFCRQAPPQVALTYRTSDGWRPVGETVPANAPLTLRLTFSREMLRETVERALKGPHDKDGGSQGAWIESLRWIDDRTLELSASTPPPVMKLILDSAQDRHGLFVGSAPAHIYAGDPPQVFALDPASGQGARLADLPLEPTWADLSPDGRRLRVTVLQQQTGQQGPSWSTLLVDLTSGKSESRKPEEFHGHWLPSGELLSVSREKETAPLVLTRHTAAGPQKTLLPDVPPYDSIYLSPDGKQLAVLERMSEYNGSYLRVRFLILSTDGKARKALTGDGYMWRPGKDGIRLYGPVWSPDSTKLALVQPAGDGQALVIADVAAGAVRTLVPKLPESRGQMDPLVWSPDGRKLLVGPLLIDAATGQIERRVEGVLNQPFWSPDGQWLLLQKEEWGEVTAYNLVTGKSASLGRGLPLGWHQEGKAILIRWANSDFRTRQGI